MVLGDHESGSIGRTHTMETNSFKKYLSNESSANTIDSCPVGASTSMPYSFTKRPRERIRH
jgi:NADH-quinone oxidoreductase subunit G